MKNKKLIRFIKNATLVMACVLFMGLLITVPAYAGLSDQIKSGVDDFAKVAKYVAYAIGGVVAIYGGVQLGLGFTQDNPDGQSKGIKYIVGGVIILAVGVILTMFGSSENATKISELVTLTPML